MEPWLLVVLLGLSVIGFALMRPSKAKEEKQNLSDIEATLDLFMGDLEEENKKLMDRFVQMKKTDELTISKLADKVKYLEKQLDMVSQNVNNPPISNPTPSITYVETQSSEVKAKETPRAESLPLDLFTVRKTSSPAIEPLEIQSYPDHETLNLRERYNELFEYYRLGKSTEYIAKKLNMNKGEVSLILELAKQEEQKRD